MTTLNIVMAQINTLVGDFSGNTAKVIDTVRRAEQAQKSESGQSPPIVVFPEQEGPIT